MISFGYEDRINYVSQLFEHMPPKLVDWNCFLGIKDI